MPSTFYTRRGDEGYTGLLGEGRVPKEDLRMETLGAIDEAGAALGLARAHVSSAGTAALILQVQRDLYGLMGEVAATPENAVRFRVIDAQKVSWLEAQVDALTAQVEIPREFIVPGDTVQGAFLDVARTVVRRAERRVSDLLHRKDIQNIELLRYLNRLSSLCFVLEIREHATASEDGTKISLAKKGEGE
jgi:cob(I)alamin adenosyltransferase